MNDISAHLSVKLFDIKEGQSKIFKKGKKERTLYVTYLLLCF